MKIKTVIVKKFKPCSFVLCSFLYTKNYNERSILFMPTKKKDTIHANNGSEKSLLSALKDITHSDAEAYFIIWKYAPELLPNSDTIKSFEDLKNTYRNFENRTEQSFEKALYKEDVQAGIKYLLRRLDGKRDVDLLNKYYDLAMGGDVQALKAYMNFKKIFFVDNEADELKEILRGASVNISDDDIDDFQMDF